MTAPKRQLFSELADLARVLGHAHRLELLEHAAQGERSVERLAQLTDMSVANASQHLQHLRRSGFVRSRRDGNHVLYCLGDGPIIELLAALQNYAEQGRAAVREIISDCFNELDRMQPVSREELIERLRDGSVTILDVRPEDEFALGHLPSAVNMPLGVLEQRLSALPSDQEIVAYCRGPYCVMSFEAVAKLRAKGFTARRLEDGFPQWKAAGLRVETT